MTQIWNRFSLSRCNWFCHIFPVFNSSIRRMTWLVWCAAGLIIANCMIIVYASIKWKTQNGYDAVRWIKYVGHLFNCHKFFVTINYGQSHANASETKNELLNCSIAAIHISFSIHTVSFLSNLCLFYIFRVCVFAFHSFSLSFLFSDATQTLIDEL